MDQEHEFSESDRRFRKWITWIAIIGTAGWAGYFVIFLIYQSLFGEPAPTNWLLQMIQAHPAATIGVGVAAISAFCLVAILELYIGRIELEGMGFKFRGATGPIFLWVLCFVVMIWGMWLLWQMK